MPPGVQQRMIPGAEPARDAPELERRPQERAPQRASALVVEAGATRRRILEVERVLRRAGHVDAGGQDAAEASLPFGRLQAIEQHREAVARADVAREVHLPVVHVGDRPGELAPLRGREERVRDGFVQGVVQRRFDRARHPQACDGPGNDLDRFDPARFAARHRETLLVGEPHADPARRAVGLQAAELEHQAGTEATHGQVRGRREETGVVAPRHAGARQHVGEDLAAAQGVAEVRVGGVHHDGGRRERSAPRPRLPGGPHQARGRERARDAVMPRAPGERHQSICRRMKVGISSSFSSAGSGGLAGALRRAGCSACFTYPGGGAPVGRPPRSRNGSTPGAARPDASAPALGRSNPVAITVTRTSPCIAGSFTLPTMISASSPAASLTTSEIWVTSPRVRSSPPVMLMSTPVAPVIEMLSSKGDEIACCTASIARFSPRPMPVPMIAAPPFCITVRTSAKSTFTIPVTVMSEEMPCVACSSTSSAFLRASWNGMPLPTTASRRSLGTTTMVSTCLRISAIPISACRIRLRPSNRNGLVTIPIVSAPRSRAICEMIGAAPVPVPPPMPQVMNTRSAFWRECSTSSRFSSMAWRPISGLAPAPHPRVSFLPICTFTSALLFSKACASVFTEMNSTPWSPSSTMRFRALPPPPPTPTTFIRAFCETVSSSSKIMAPSGDRSEEVLQPPLQRSEQLVDPRTPDQRAAGHGALREPPRRVQHQPDGHRVARRLHAVDQSRDPLLGAPGPHRHRERLARQLHHPRQMRRPTRQHHAGRQPAAPVPRPLHLALPPLA